MSFMSTNTLELMHIYEQLPKQEQAEVVDFARFLLAKHDDQAWERAIADPRPRPKLDEFVRAALAEGTEALNVDKM
jgi:hypothetical protein